MLVEEMANARDFVSWKLAASQLDVLEGTRATHRCVLPQRVIASDR